MGPGRPALRYLVRTLRACEPTLSAEAPADRAPRPNGATSVAGRTATSPWAEVANLVSFPDPNQAEAMKTAKRQVVVSANVRSATSARSSAEAQRHSGSDRLPAATGPPGVETFEQLQSATQRLQVVVPDVACCWSSRYSLFGNARTTPRL